MSRVHGRCDDLLIVGGTKFFPARLAEVLLQVEGLAPQAELVITREGATDQLEVRAEIAPEFALLDEIKNLERLRQDLRRRLQLALGLEPRITLVEHGALVRAGGKRLITVTDRRTS
jgi:phenylacetate-CoA ligase